jgi:predicted anti-sigma-YlaC factor YlaD
MSDADLTCEELVELVTEYLEGGLDDEARALFEEHVVVCMGCANYLDQIRTTIEVVGHVSVDDLSEATKADLLAAFRGWDRS